MTAVSFLRRASIGAAALAVVAGGVLAGTGTASAAVCGYNDDIDGRAVYNHCGSTNVMIEYTIFSGGHGQMCVPPGLRDMGPSWLVSNAWYIGSPNCILT
ncbi:DUF6355 family natural product biosynthesis protein [Lentzea cavernae]|uniref:Secreted protein n=1 Tax=Lentzea cavernae TaxID=2020703 RepID=A0ABQ3MUT7_9PSEU|nr:DUF6355 family natural product biosynthesis protein [Lentzea cavernae]GHH63813.1 hypothetical protein GCM10017774_93560 [Lentzea cavernae]